MSVGIAVYANEAYVVLARLTLTVAMSTVATIFRKYIKIIITQFIIISLV